MSTIYAAFRDANHAQRALRDLLADGISTDDVSLLAHQAEGTTRNNGVGHLEDASYFVGRNDDPVQDAAAERGEDSPGVYYDEESPVSTGIASDSPDDAAESIDQMDDSQWQAEMAMLEPDDRPVSRHEVDNLQLTLQTGFPTPVPAIEPIPQSAISSNMEVADSIDTVEMPGFAIVQGGGALATAAIASDDQDRRSSLLGFFSDNGIPISKATLFIDTFENGGAVLAVEIVPGEVDPDRVAALATKHNAIETGLYDAPRF